MPAHRPRGKPCPSCKILPGRRANIADVRGREELVDGKREDLIRLPLGDRERAATVAKMRRRFLEVDRYRIVDRGLDTLVGKIFLEVVATVRLHDEGVEGVELDVAANRDEQGKAGELGAVLRGVAAPAFDDSGQVTQANPEHLGLDRVEA